MKILCVTNLYPPYIIGGYEQLAHKTMQALAARGHQVFVATGQGSAFDENPHIFGVYDLNLDEKDAAFFAARQGIITPFKRLLYHPANDRATRQLIQQLQPDIVSFWNLRFLSIAPMIAARDCRVPRVTHLTDHWLLDNLKAISNVFSPVGALKQTALQLVQRFFQPILYHRVQPDHLIVPSRSLQAAYQQAGFQPDRFHLIPHGIETGVFPIKPPSTDPDATVRLLYVGQLWEGKGIQILLRALGWLRQQNIQNFRLDVYGSGTEAFMQQLQNIVSEMQLDEVVHFCGRVAYTDLPPIYQQHDVLIFPSIWNEPFALVPLEAMSSGLPVIASTAGGTQEAVRHGETGLIVPAGEVVALAQALQTLIQQPEQRQQYGQRAAALARETYDFKVMVDRVEAFYQTIIADKDAHA